MKIKVTSCPNDLLWYDKYIGQVFEVLREEPTAFWTLEPNEKYRLLNWINKTDCEVINQD
jgi:hypothetical protein